MIVKSEDESQAHNFVCVQVQYTKRVVSSSRWYIATAPHFLSASVPTFKSPFSSLKSQFPCSNTYYYSLIPSNNKLKNRTGKYTFNYYPGCVRNNPVSSFRLAFFLLFDFLTGSTITRHSLSDPRGPKPIFILSQR